MITVHKQLTSIPPHVRMLLRKLCFRDGVMGSILDRFERGEQTRAHRYAVILWSKTKTPKPIAWALIDNSREAHVYTAVEHRKKGYAPLVLAVLLSALPRKKSKALRWADRHAKMSFLIAKYVYLNKLTPPWTFQQ